jgi:hypothetical protein
MIVWTQTDKIPGIWRGTLVAGDLTLSHLDSFDLTQFDQLYVKRVSVNYVNELRFLIHAFKDKTIYFVYGDYRPFLSLLSDPRDKVFAQWPQ